MKKNQKTLARNRRQQHGRARKTRLHSSAAQLAPTANSPRVLVIDDDPMFRSLMNEIGRKQNIAVTSYASLEELSKQASRDRFDVAIVDYFLDDLDNEFTGTDVAYALEDLPVVLVSNTNYTVESHDPWPSSVRKFMNKKAGGEAILSSAVQLRRASAL